MRVLRQYNWMLCLLGLALLFGIVRGPLQTTQATGPAPSKSNKVIIYPKAGETISQLEQGGIRKVDDYGSFWVATATEEQVDSLRKTHGDRAVKANRLNRIDLSAAAIDTTVGEPSIPGNLRQAETAGKRLRLIQFEGPVQPRWVEQVKSAGPVTVVSYVPNNAYLVWLDEEAEQKLAETVNPQGPIQWIGPYHPYYKIQQDLLNVSGNQPIKVRVAVVDDPQDVVTSNGIQALGLVDTTLTRNGQRIIEMDVSPAAILPIAQLPGVLWIERVYSKRILDEVQDLVLASQTNGPLHGPSTTLGITNYLDFLINTVGGGLPSFVDPFTYPIVDIADTGLDNGTSQPYHPAFYYLGDPSLTNFARIAYFGPPWLAGDPLQQLGCTTRIVPGNRGAFRTLEAADLDGHGTFVASILAGFDAGTNIVDKPSLFVVTFSNTTTVAIPGPEPGNLVDCSEIMGNSAAVTIPISLGMPDVCGPEVFTNVTFTISSNSCPTNVSVTVLYSQVVTQDISETRRDSDGFQLGMGVSPFGLIGIDRVWGTMESSSFSLTTINNVCVPEFNAFGLCINNLQTLIAIAYSSFARIQNNSWADAIDVDGLNGGLYTTDAQTYDIGVRDAVLVGQSNNVPGPSPLNQEFIVVFACSSLLYGNAGSEGNAGGFADMRVTSPATAKNVVSVGASVNPRLLDGCPGTPQFDSLEMWLASAPGPTRDGRFKPEIVAPGASVQGAVDLLAPSRDFPVSGLTATNCTTENLVPFDPSVIDSIDPSCTSTSTVYTSLYTCDSGSSFAAPAVSGGIQLLWWYFQNRLVNELGTPLFQPSPAMAKAYLCNSARYLPIVNPQTGAMDTLPSILQGMGEMDLLRMFDGVSRVIRDESTPRAIDVPLITTNPAPQQTYFNQSGQSYEINGQVASNGLPFRVTLTWADAPGSPANFGQLMNDLDLQVTVGGRVYKGNVFSEDHSVVGGTFDSVNNTESVFLPAGAVSAGQVYSVLVRASNIAADGVPQVGSSLDQDFALVVYNSQTNSTTLSDVPNLATNDACSTAIDIADFPYVFSNNLNTTTYHNVQPSPSAARGGVDEFFKIDQPTMGTTFTIDTFGSSFDTVLSVWEVQTVPQGVFVRGPCGALVELVSNNNAGGGLQSQVSFTADGSNTYYIVVEPRNNGSGGTMLLNVQASSLVTLAPTNLVFGAQFVGTTSAVQTITFQNNAPLAVNVADVTVGGANPSDFVISEDCSGKIPPGSNCTISVRFAPTGNGTRTGQVIVDDDATGGPHTASLSGTGLTPIPAVCASANALSFGSVTVGFTSAAKSVTITNCGTAALVISNSATITGANAGDFAIATDLCSGNSISPGGTCTFSVTFTPLANGSRTASLVFSDNAIGSPHSVNLSGTGAAPAPQVCLSTGTLTFGNQEAGTTSSVLSVTVTNCGTANLLINTATITGANATDFRIVSDVCSGGTLVPNANCTIGVVFNPGLTNIANRTASLQIPDNASGSPQSVTLSGTAFGSQPDVMLSKSKKMKKAIGSGVINNTGANQTLTIKIGRKKKKVFYIAFKNAGTIMDAFPVSGGGNVPGQLTVNYFVGAKNFNGVVNEVTSSVAANTYSTSSLAPGAITGDSTLLRLQVTIDAAATQGTTYNIPVTAHSSLNPAKQDTVVVQVIVH